MKKMKMMVAAGCLAVTGCMTSPVAFKSESAPVPPQGYTVMGSDVTGSSEQIWVFGFGGDIRILYPSEAVKEIIDMSRRMITAESI